MQNYEQAILTNDETRKQAAVILKTFDDESFEGLDFDLNTFEGSEA